MAGVLIAARGARGHEWAKMLRGADDALLAVLDLDAGGVEGLDEMLAAHPDAAVAVWAAGPREAALAATRLAEHEGPAILHPPPDRPPDGDFQLAHGWLTLGGIGALERLFSSGGVEAVRLVARGLPEGSARGIVPALYQALAVVHRLGREVSVDGAVLAKGPALTLMLTVDGAPWRVEVDARGHGLELAVRTREGDYEWGADEVSERLRRPRGEARVLPATPWAQRTLAQLERPVVGADAGSATRIRATMDAVEQRLERRLPPDRLPIVDPADGLDGLGLDGEVPLMAPLAPQPSATVPDLAALAYTLELRPACVLIVAPQDADAIARDLPGTVERRPVDRAHVALYAARDPATAARLADLHDAPDAHHDERGALLGYPACCVQAYDPALEEPGSRTTLVAARTSVGPGPWPGWLDDTALPLLAHSLCTYRCERSLAAAEALLDALKVEDPALRRTLTAARTGPVLFFDAAHQLRFRGESLDPMSVRYDAVTLPASPSEAFSQLAGAVAEGDRLVLTDRALTVYAGDAHVVELRRRDPGLGIILPFAAG